MKYKINTLDIRLHLLLTHDPEIWPAEQKNLMDCYSYSLQQISLVHIFLPTLHPSPLDATPTTFHLNKKCVLYNHNTIVYFMSEYFQANYYLQLNQLHVWC